jgi:hypothetical protein
MRLDEAKIILERNGFVLGDTGDKDYRELTSDEQMEFVDELKGCYRGVSLTKTKGIKISGFGEPIWVRIWKYKTQYKFSCDYVTPDGYLHETWGSQGKAKTVEGLIKKINDVIGDILEENDDRWSSYDDDYND